MTEDVENLTLRLLQEMRRDMADMRHEIADMRQEMSTFREEVNEKFDTVNARLDGVTHIMTMIAAHTFHLDERLTKLERAV